MSAGRRPADERHVLLPDRPAGSGEPGVSPGASEKNRTAGNHPASADDSSYCRAFVT